MHHTHRCSVHVASYVSIYGYGTITLGEPNTCGYDYCLVVVCEEQISVQEIVVVSVNQISFAFTFFQLLLNLFLYDGSKSSLYVKKDSHTLHPFILVFFVIICHVGRWWFPSICHCGIRVVGYVLDVSSIFRPCSKLQVTPGLSENNC